MTRGQSGTLPSGTVTLVLGDVESSTEQWEASADAMAAAMKTLHATLDELVAAHSGARPLEQGEGDSFVTAFTRAADAVAFAEALQRQSPLPIRIGIHSGDVEVVDGGYAGTTIIRAARLRDAGHGGQVLLSQVTAALVADEVELDDLGEHHLKGLERAERVWQLPGDFPALRLSDAPTTPQRLTTFIGRELELAHVGDLVKEPGCVTITGAGGAGKTRLALELVAARGAQRQPSWFVDLASVDREDGVVTAVADAVGARLTPNRSERAAITAALRDKDGLLVLDNCEHLLPACSGLAAYLLERSGALAVLATSREPLGLDGEVTYRLPSLAESEGVELFVERAQRADPRFALDAQNAQIIGEICTRLDGMPLAIELAAARMRVFSVEQLLEVLHDRFRLLTGGARTALPRQRTLEASVDWSHALLLDAERVLLRRLSVFAGSFTVDAAVSVTAGGELETHHVFDLLVQLVEKSLVTTDDRHSGRFRMLETIRHYAAARLVDAGEADDCRRRHYEFFLRAAHHGRERTEGEWRADVERDEPNFRRALQWASDQPGYETLLALTEELSLYWNATRRATEGAAWLALLDERTEEASDDIRARVLCDRGLVVASIGDYMTAGRLASDAIAHARATGDDGLLLKCLLQSNPALSNSSGVPDGMLDEAERLAVAVGDPRWLALISATRAMRRMREEGDVAGALPLLLKAYEVTSAAGMESLAAMADAWVVMGHLFLGQVEEGLAGAARATHALRTLGDTFVLTNLLAYLVSARLGTGDDAGAARDLAELDEIADECGDAGTEINRRAGHGLLALIRGDWPAAADWFGPFAHLPDTSVGAFLKALLAAADALAGRVEAAETSAVALRNQPFQMGGLVTICAVIALAEAASRRGDETQAWDVAYEALTATASSVPFANLLLGVLARTTARLGRTEEAVRLIGALDAAQGWMTGAEQALLAPTEAVCRDTLGAERYDALIAEGAAMTVDQAFALVQRGRGSRQRPMLGWDSLTPTEAQVAALVAQGASNKDTAAQLFMSEATVKTHLTRIFAKVGVKNRAQLGAAHRSS